MMHHASKWCTTECACYTLKKGYGISIILLPSLQFNLWKHFIHNFKTSSQSMPFHQKFGRCKSYCVLLDHYLGEEMSVSASVYVMLIWNYTNNFKHNFAFQRIILKQLHQKHTFDTFLKGVCIKSTIKFHNFSITKSCNSMT